MNTSACLRNTIQASDTASQESWKVVETWMQECISSHQACNRHSRTERTWYPTRLLLIGEHDTIRLTCTATEQPRGPYTTLSHCWGKVPLIQLLRSNMKEFAAGVPQDTLPKTFQHAIIATKRLGASYIWIDSLCILQDKDDLSDWLQESALMGKVYSNSYCNISATAALDSSKGLFHERSAKIVRPMYASMAVEDDSYNGSSIEYSIVNRSLWLRQVTNTPLNVRGWGKW